MTKTEQELRARLSSIDRPTQLLAASIPAYANQKGRCPAEANLSDHYQPESRGLLFLHLVAFGLLTYFYNWLVAVIALLIAGRLWLLDMYNGYRRAKLFAQQVQRSASEAPIYKQYDELASALKIRRADLTFEVVRLISAYSTISPEAEAAAAERAKVEAAAAERRERMRENNARWLANRPKILLDQCVEDWALFFDRGMPGIADWLLHKRS